MLVEIGAQPVQLFFVGKLGRGDGLVIFGRPDFIIALRQMVPIAALRGDGLHAVIAHFAVGTVLIVHILAVIICLGLFAFTLLWFGAGFGLASFAFAIIVAVAVLVLAVLGILAAFIRIGRIDVAFCQVQMLEHGLRERGKCTLIVKREGKRVKVAACFFLNPAAQHINARNRRVRYRRAGQAFAHDER